MNTVVNFGGRLNAYESDAIGVWAPVYAATAAGRMV